MSELLPIGTEVLVTPWPLEGQETTPYRARIHGYDMGHTKYNLSRRIAGWGEYFFTEHGGDWRFPGEVVSVNALLEVLRAQCATLQARIEELEREKP